MYPRLGLDRLTLGGRCSRTARVVSTIGEI